MTTTAAVKQMVALVTGGASGLGKATVQRLVSKGYNVGLLDLQLSDGQKVAEELGTKNVLYTPVDVSSFEQVNTAISAVAERFGHINVVVNCAGIAYAQKLFSPTRRYLMEEEKIDKIIKVNLYGTIYVIQCAIPHLLENHPDENNQRGLIINTSSIAAYDGQAGQVLYSATKGAIASMTLPLARDYGVPGIRFMAIAPGMFDTPLMQSLPPKAKAFLCKMVLSPPRLGKPEEFATLVETIIDNPYLNGEVIRLDGGLRMAP